MGAPVGVRGWLLLFCVVLTFLNPASIAYQMVVALRLGLDVVGTVYVLGYSAIALFSLTAGLFLWQVRPNAVTTAKIFLLTQAGFAVALWIKVLLGTANTSRLGCGLGSRYSFPPSALCSSLVRVPDQVKACPSNLSNGLFRRN